MRGPPRGAGRGGGLLFLALLLFVAYLAITAIAGALRFVLGVAFLIVLGLAVLSVVRRR